jgi:hypothetical protein
MDITAAPFIPKNPMEMLSKFSGPFFYEEDHYTIYDMKGAAILVLDLPNFNEDDFSEFGALLADLLSKAGSVDVSRPQSGVRAGIFTLYSPPHPLIHALLTS